MQDGDILLFQTLNDGDISIQDGVAIMTRGLETAVYLSMFSPKDWFCNENIDDKHERISAKTEDLINNKPQSSANYQLLVQAVKSDLGWLIKTNIANSIDVSVSSDGLNSVTITIAIEQDAGSSNITLPIQWGTNG